MKVTRSPTLTVISGGLRPAPLILTVGGSEGAGTEPGAVGVEESDEVELLPHADAESRREIVTKAEMGFRPR
jgi:hypothetical protein